MKPPTREDVLDVLRLVYDPEVPVNIVDLGLVYDVALDAGAVQVKMTLTAAGCSMGPMIAADARARIFTLRGVTDARVDLVFDPPWDPGRMTDAGRRAIGMPCDERGAL